MLLAYPAVVAMVAARPWTIASFSLAGGAWLLALAGACLPNGRWELTRPGALAVGGAAALTALTAASIAWTPLLEPAANATVLALLYLGLLAAAVPALARRAAARIVEPALALTITGFALWGLSDRLLPGVFELDHSRIELGRLTAPIGYWNVMGSICGMGLVLVCSIAADAQRRIPLRAAAAAFAPALATAIWLSFSRGALAATAAGLFTLIAIGRTRARAAAAIGGLLSLIVAAITSESLAGVRDLSMPLSERESDGIVALLIIALAGALAAVTVIRSSRSGRPGSQSPSPRVGLRAAGLLACVLAVAPFVSVLAGEGRSSTPMAPSGSDIERLASAESLRTEYWQVSLDLFSHNPAVGTGAGSFGAEWNRQRFGPGFETPQPPARNAHSLPVETLGELGLIGLLALLAFAAGAALCARRGLKLDRSLVAGPTAALVVFASHSTIDWDWQVAAITSAAMLLTGVLISSSGPSHRGDRGGTPRLIVALAASTALLWFGWNAWTLRLTERAGATIETAGILGWTDDRWSRTADLIDSARVLNPDANPATYLAIAASRSGRDGIAIRAARDLVRDNPGSWFAWNLLALVSADSDPDLSLDARARSLELRPQPVNR